VANVLLRREDRASSSCSFLLFFSLNLLYSSSLFSFSFYPSVFITLYRLKLASGLREVYNRWSHHKTDLYSHFSEACSEHFITSHHITSHRGNGSRPQGPLYPRNNNCNKFINTLLLIYNTAVSGASEISFIIKNYFLV